VAVGGGVDAGEVEGREGEVGRWSKEGLDRPDKRPRCSPGRVWRVLGSRIALPHLHIRRQHRTTRRQHPRPEERPIACPRATSPPKPFSLRRPPLLRSPSHSIVDWIFILPICSFPYQSRLAIYSLCWTTTLRIGVLRWLSLRRNGLDPTGSPSTQDARQRSASFRYGDR
jgi:hypothetical protein